MPRFRPTAAALAGFVAAALLATAAAAHDYTLGAIRIGHPHARATTSGQPVGSGYLVLSNGGPADRLLGAQSPVAALVEMHTMQMDGDVMRMRRLDAVELPAGQTIEFKPGGNHLMLIGLRQALQAGSRVPLTLQFERAGKIDVELAVDPAGAAADAHRH